MKKLIFALVAVLFAGFTFISCDKKDKNLESVSESDLIGKWQLVSETRNGKKTSVPELFVIELTSDHKVYQTDQQEKHVNVGEWSLNGTTCNIAIFGECKVTELTSSKLVIVINDEGDELVMEFKRL